MGISSFTCYDIKKYIFGYILAQKTTNVNRRICLCQVISVKKTVKPIGWYTTALACSSTVLFAQCPRITMRDFFCLTHNKEDAAQVKFILPPVQPDQSVSVIEIF